MVVSAPLPPPPLPLLPLPASSGGCCAEPGEAEERPPQGLSLGVRLPSMGQQRRRSVKCHIKDWGTRGVCGKRMVVGLWSP